MSDETMIQTERPENSSDNIDMFLSAPHIEHATGYQTAYITVGYKTSWTYSEGRDTVHLHAIQISSCKVFIKNDERQ